MKLVIAAAIGAVGTIGAMPSLVDHDTPRIETVAVHSRLHMDSESYLLRVVGKDQPCSVVLRDGSHADQLAKLDLAPACAGLFDRLGEAQFWLENQEGDIFFVAGDGRTVAQFFPGDGVAYESVKPATPLMMLTEQSRTD
jgi:hypothetical protein